MTDQELIKVLRCCQKAVGCLSCEAFKDCSGIEGVLEQAADRLEALLAENVRLGEELQAVERTAELLNHANPSPNRPAPRGWSE